MAQLMDYKQAVHHVLADYMKRHVAPDAHGNILTTPDE